MGRIANNVDTILTRHDISGQVAMVKEDEAGGNMHEGMVNKVDYGQRRGQRRGRGGYNNSRQAGKGNSLKCAHCDYLAQMLRLKINTNHKAQECWRKNIAVWLMSTAGAITDSFSSAEVPRCPHSDNVVLY